MWQDTKEGVAKQFITRQNETVTFEIKRRAGVGVIHRDGYEQVICGVREGQIKIWNDMLFDSVTYEQIRSKMIDVFKKSKKR